MSSDMAVVITCSTRAANGTYEDTTGPSIVAGLEGLGLSVLRHDVVADGPQIEEALRGALADGADLVVTTGGTGIAPSDCTPEYTRRVLDVELPGMAEELRLRGLQAGVPTAVLSRGVAGVAASRSVRGRALVVNLPGSRGGVKDGMALLGEVLVHALDQLGGGDHRRSDR